MLRRPADHRPRRAAAALELAVLLPFLIFLFAVAVDFCRVFYYTQTLQNAAYTGALYASGVAQPGPSGTSVLGVPQPMTPADAAKQAAAAEGTTLNPPLQSATVQVQIANGTAKVTVSHDCKMLTPLMGTGRVVTLTREVSMQVVR